jgi:hypothetical protein
VIKGPFGIHTRLNCDAKYSKIIESLLQGTLNSLGVETIADSHLLSSLLKKHGVYLQIYKVSNKKLDYSHGLPDKSLTTVLDCLRFDSDVVRDQLIINNKIEQTVLVSL